MSRSQWWFWWRCWGAWSSRCRFRMWWRCRIWDGTVTPRSMPGQPGGRTTSWWRSTALIVAIGVCLECLILGMRSCMQCFELGQKNSCGWSLWWVKVAKCLCFWSIVKMLCFLVRCYSYLLFTFLESFFVFLEDGVEFLFQFRLYVLCVYRWCHFIHVSSKKDYVMRLNII